MLPNYFIHPSNSLAYSYKLPKKGVNASHFFFIERVPSHTFNVFSREREKNEARMKGIFLRRLTDVSCQMREKSYLNDIFRQNEFE